MRIPGFVFCSMFSAQVAVSQTVTGFSAIGTGASEWTANKNGGIDPAITAGTLSLLPASGTTLARSVFYNTPVSVAAFSVSFRFDNGLNGAGSDGFTFVLQNGPNTALGGAGESLGYEAAGENFQSSFAISFNIVGSDSIAFGQAGNRSNVGAFTNLTPSNGPNTALLDLADIVFSYDGARLDVSVSNANDSSQIFSRSVDVNIPGILGTYSALMGFTAANFNATPMDVSNFNYSAVPEPSSFALLLGAFAGLIGVLRRQHRRV